MRSLVVIAGFFAALALPGAASAQTQVGLYRGVGEYDLSGVDDAPVTAFRVSRGVSRFLTLEVGVTHAELDLDAAAETTLIQPELQAQLQLPLGAVAPYVGAGIGAGFASADDGQDDSEITLNAGLGLRIELAYGLGLAADARLRSFGTDFTASGGDLSVGVTYRF